MIDGLAGPHLDMHQLAGCREYPVSALMPGLRAFLTDIPQMNPQSGPDGSRTSPDSGSVLSGLGHFWTFGRAVSNVRLYEAFAVKVDLICVA